MLYQPKKIRETIEGRFEIDEVIRIERRNDPHTISDKIFDFSRGTIKGLLEDGYDDAKIELENRLRVNWKRLDKMCTVRLVKTALTKEFVTGKVYED